MGMIIDSKESRIAREFLLKSKAAFSEKIPRETVKDIDISECVRDETYAAAARIVMTGSVETVSPTGKSRTHLYHATVDVNGKNAEIAALKVTSQEE